ncbi:MAG: 3-dehydroquinate dehydratase [Myxococcales bacterium]|nr:3-dehydroquinate dehydratase [Myxococcales bacterium]
MHGPNLNLLGRREPEIYGTSTLDALDATLRAEALREGISLRIEQSNHEGVLIDWIQAAMDGAKALVLNAGGFTHTSVAIRDAAAAAASVIPIVEVHLSQPSGREPFRQTSLLAGVVAGRIEGFGPYSYVLALKAASALIRARGVQLRDQ